MNTIVTSPAEAIASLRNFYVERHVAAFEEDSATRFAFKAPLDDFSVMITALALRSIPQLCLVTRVLTDPVADPQEAHRLCNYLNGCCVSASIYLSEELDQFILESTLPLGDGMCFQSQLSHFADGHMAAVAQLAPLLHAFASGQIDSDEASSWLAQAGPTAKDSSPPRFFGDAGQCGTDPSLN